MKPLQRALAVVFAAALAATASAQTPADTSARNLSLEQQTKIADAITRAAGPPIAAGHFTLAIGNTVPADVSLRPVPTSVATAAPQLPKALTLQIDRHMVDAPGDLSQRNSRLELQRLRRPGVGDRPAGGGRDWTTVDHG
jgi:hypothetical protein